MMGAEPILEQFLDLLVFAAIYFFLGFVAIFTVKKGQILVSLLQYFDKLYCSAVSLGSFVREYNNLFTHLENPH
jgi:hypothetical protein